MKQFWDSKMVIWIMSLIFFAGGGWFQVEALAQRVNKLEMKQDAVGEDIRTMMKNQAKMCQALEVSCQ
jgi:hypothetical protein